MNTQGKSQKSTGPNIEPKEEQRRLLPCSEVSTRCSSLDFISNSPLVSEDMQLDYLASILVGIFLELKKHGYTPTKKGSDILPSIDKRTS
jgi:hypothetical protein